MWEFELESTYLDHIYRGGGCRTPGYTPIFASGPNAAILHYGHAAAPNGALAGRCAAGARAQAGIWQLPSELACTPH